MFCPWTKSVKDLMTPSNGKKRHMWRRITFDQVLLRFLFEESFLVVVVQAVQ